MVITAHYLRGCNIHISGRRGFAEYALEMAPCDVRNTLSFRKIGADSQATLRLCSTGITNTYLFTELSPS
jgi:hypothetical protein